MRAALVLMIGMVFWLVTPAVSEAHKVKQHNDRGYSQQHDDNRGYDGRGYEVRNKQHNRHQQKAWKKHRKAEKRWARRHVRHQPPVKVIYRDRWPFPLFPRIVINIPL